MYFLSIEKRIGFDKNRYKTYFKNLNNHICGDVITSVTKKKPISGLLILVIFAYLVLIPIRYPRES